MQPRHIAPYRTIGTVPHRIAMVECYERLTGNSVLYRTQIDDRDLSLRPPTLCPTNEPCAPTGSVRHRTDILSVSD